MNEARRKVVRLYLAVGSGAALGSFLRFLSGLVIVPLVGHGTDWTTAFVNVVGSFVIGLFATLTRPEGRLLVGPEARQFVMAGICGGLTTFSAMSLSTFTLAHDIGIASAGLYLALVLALSLVAAWLGHALATRINR